MSSFFDAVIDEVELSQQQMGKVFSLFKNKDVTVALLKDKLDKEKLSTLLLEMMRRTQSCVSLLKKASGEIELRQKDAKLADSKIIKLQGELIDCKENQICHFKSLIEEELPETIKSEMKSYSDVVKSYSDVVKKSACEPLSIRSIKTAVKDAVKIASKNSERETNIIMFGLPECPADQLHDMVADVFQTIDEKPRFTAHRFGLGKVSARRPVKVSFERQETVKVILKKAKELKDTENYKDVYNLSSDMSPEKRTKKRKLVQEMKKKIAADPDTRCYIRGNKLCYEAVSVLPLKCHQELVGVVQNEHNDEFPYLRLLLESKNLGADDD